MDVTRLDQISKAVDDVVKNLNPPRHSGQQRRSCPDNLAENVREQDFDFTLAVN